MINYRNDIESTYEHVCNIYNKQSVFNEETKLTDFKDIEVYSNIPCRISFKDESVTKDSNVGTFTQKIKLFIDNRINIPPGSTIEVTYNNTTNKYKQSGKPIVYPCHQEIILQEVDFA